jgi:hypothetical protein
MSRPIGKPDFEDSGTSSKPSVANPAATGVAGSSTAVEAVEDTGVVIWSSSLIG